VFNSQRCCYWHHPLQYVRKWISSIYFLYTCFIYGSFGGFYWFISKQVFGLFWQLLLLDMFELGRIILGLVLLFFPCSFLLIFLYYYLSYSCIIMGQFYICQPADHHLLLRLPNWAVAYCVFLLDIYLIGSIVSVTLLGIIMPLDMSTMSHHVFLIIWYHNESLLFPNIRPSRLITLRTQYLLKIWITWP